MDRREAIEWLKSIRRTSVFEQVEALDLAIEALGQTEIVRCKDCKHYNPPHIEYNNGTRKDYPDEFVTTDIGINVGGKCENSTTTMRTYCTAHDRENPDDFEELVIFRQPTEYCSFGEKAEKHQLSGETSTISENESVEGIAESATTTEEVVDFNNMISDCNRIRNLPPVNQKQVTSKLESAEIATLEGEESTMNQPKSKLDCISKHDLWRIIEDNAYWVTYNETSKEKGMTLTGINQALNECPPVTPTERTTETMIVDGREMEIDPVSYEIGYSHGQVAPTERTGEWEYEPSNGVDRCSVCGTGFRNGFCIRNVEAFNFCPNCGAKMGGDTE